MRSDGYHGLLKPFDREFGVPPLGEPKHRALPRVAGGQEMTYGRSLQRHLAHFNLPAAFMEWAPLAQDRAGWRKLVTEPPFKL